MSQMTYTPNPITITRLLGLAAVLVWGAMAIGAPLAMAILVHAPAGKIGLAIGNVVLAAVMGVPWSVFGLQVIRRFFAA